MLRIHVQSGEEVIETITKQLKKNHITEGSITFIGAVDSCCISTMPKKNAKEDILIEYHEPLEVSGTGEVTEGKPHLHAVLGREGNQAIFGHLHWAKIKEWFVNVYVTSLKDN